MLRWGYSHVSQAENDPKDPNQPFEFKIHYLVDPSWESFKKDFPNESFPAEVAQELIQTINL
jgi:hypothetical protein